MSFRVIGVKFFHFPLYWVGTADVAGTADIAGKSFDESVTVDEVDVITVDFAVIVIEVGTSKFSALSWCSCNKNASIIIKKLRFLWVKHTESDCAPLAQALFEGESGNSVIVVSIWVVPAVNGRCAAIDEDRGKTTCSLEMMNEKIFFLVRLKFIMI